MENEACPVKRVAIAVVQRTGAGGQIEFLVGRRAAGQTLPGCDEFPGGGIRKHESPCEAALRECCEETGVQFAEANELLVVEHQYDFGRLELHFYLCLMEPAATTKALSPFRWVTKDRLAACSFPAANEPVLKRLLGEGSPGC